MSNDLVVGAVGLQVKVPQIIKTPYLVELEAGKKREYYVTLDKPDLSNSCVTIKGVSAEISDVDEFMKNYNDFLSDVKKENIVEAIFPWHRVIRITNLVYKAK